MLSKQRVLIVGNTPFFSLLPRHMLMQPIIDFGSLFCTFCVCHVCFQVVIESITGPKCA